MAGHRAAADRGHLARLHRHGGPAPARDRHRRPASQSARHTALGQKIRHRHRRRRRPDRRDDVLRRPPRAGHAHARRALRYHACHHERRPRVSMSQGPRKTTLTVHIACSVGWFGAIAAYITLNVPALTGSNDQTVRAAYLMMLPVAWYAIVPLAIATLLTGIVLALGTPWGLFRHYWVIFSLIITVIAVAILLGHMADVDTMARLAGDPDADISRLSGDLDHSIGGLLVLLAPLVLNIY